VPPLNDAVPSEKVSAVIVKAPTFQFPVRGVEPSSAKNPVLPAEA